MIDHRSSHFKGQSPVSVLQHSLLDEFENLHPDFKQYAKELIGKGDIDPIITYDAMDTRVKSPFAVSIKIVIPEGFCSFVWSLAYCLVVFHHEITVKLSKNNYYGNEDEQPDKQLLKRALALFNFAMRIRTTDEEWDLSLPNPALYEEDQKDIIEKVNALFLSAMKYVIGHEFAHIELKHSSPIGAVSKTERIAHGVKSEEEADARSIELALLGVSLANKDTLQLGILVGLFSILLLNEDSQTVGYPDADDRIGIYLESLDIDDNHYLWAVATLGYKLWDLHYQKGLIWPKDLLNYKTLYFDIRSQLKKTPK
jgi:hypothetical protein